jgi:hypothetical protein
MTLQEWIAYALGAVAVAYLMHRAGRRRRRGTCCGETECGATRRILGNLERMRR